MYLAIIALSLISLILTAATAILALIVKAGIQANVRFKVDETQVFQEADL